MIWWRWSICYSFICYFFYLLLLLFFYLLLLLLITSEHTLRDLIKTTSGYNDADRFVTLLFDEMKIKENLILVEHREFHWFYWFRRHCHKYLELWKERRFRYTCIGVFCQGCFFKFKVQFIGVFRTQSNIYDDAFLRK